MSYLQFPRIHFAGRFQADTSTVNNDVRHFDSEKFRQDFQAPMLVEDQKIVKYNGYWNPEGTGAWRLLGCRVTAAVVDGRTMTDSSEDPVVGQIVGGSTDRVSGKLVDLDPQQQMVSQIWGLAVNLHDANGVPSFTSDFEVAPFCDLWLRQQNADHFLDQQLAAAYQSVLTGVKWLNYRESRCLRAMLERSAYGRLSIRMNLLGYDRTPGAPDYSTGIVVGTIGIFEQNEPRHFVRGRQLTAALTQGANVPPFIPLNQVGNIQAVCHTSNTVISADFGNALPTTDSIGTLQDLGPLAFGILKDPSVVQGASVTADGIEILGTIPYLNPGWFFTTGGVQDFRLSANARNLIQDHPVAVVKAEQNGTYTVMNRETADGVFVRADNFVYRLNPGDEAHVHFHGTRYGLPLATTISAMPVSGLMGGPGTGAKLPDIPVPEVNTPLGTVAFPTEFQTDAHGRATMTITASDKGPGNPRQYLDGQVYGIGYQFKNLPPNYNSAPFNFVSVLAWDHYEIPAHPTWHEHIQPILSQYANLYPIMSRRLVNLNNYVSVITNLSIVKLTMLLPIENPNSMPVTRDMSAAKRQTVLKWLNMTDAATGLPPLGAAPAHTPQPVPIPASPEVAGATTDMGSKFDFVRLAMKAHT